MTRVVDPEGAHVRVLRGLADFSGARVLEIGAGEGRLTTGFAADAASVLAIDSDRDSIAEAERTLPDALRDTVSFRVASIAELEIPKGEFDLALFSWSL